MRLNGEVYSDAENIYLENTTNLLKLVIYSYHQMLENENLEQLRQPDEPIIRNILIRYLQLKTNKKRFGLENTYFIPEPAEIDENTYQTKGLADIKVFNILDSLKFPNIEREEDIYFIFECKRLDGYSKLTTPYVEKGISRFVIVEEKHSSTKYSSEMPLAGMIAFVQSGKIEKIVKDINKKLIKFSKQNEIELIKHLEYFQVNENFNYTYHSIHERQNQLPKIDIYHLMFNFA